ncbi:peptidase M23-like protein [Algoriphagus ratkowskyi]|uniref:Peptidase M23-like protein n=1 Tax=Algoriphagus ratkowskyi TaxID=57028 RepID=A0A2W7RGC6_9BACT|nr:peptidoglycan DD-metalloendopeptidase family protein [Algoriphagus ratkowskyi]PZX54617.1 peptidase M23-like protein [Algoriphagus ratkowskyi]TXD76928.1 peptidoglycan DD-metalloendopeptidase family protein [Algoriphagus ratkowskyi]
MKKIWIGIATLVITVGAASSLQFFDLPFQTEKEAAIVEPPLLDSLASQVFLYGINVTGLNIVEGTVSKNQTLGSILAPFNVPYQIIDQIAKKSKEIFDVRGIAANRKFTVVTPADSSQAAYFIYEPNSAEYVVFNLDSIDIYKAEKPAEFRTKEAGGIINSNLSADMTSQGVTYDIIDQFADLYGWSIDFGALQKGDKYKVTYQEKVIDGVVVGVSGIQTAYFEHKSVPYYAIPFEQNGEVTFFDQNGDSFKKAFLRDPLKYSRISSRYSLKRFHPVQKRYKAHLGTDYAAPTGTEIRSVGEGTVVDAKYSSANGNYVKIKHNGTYTTQYLHMSKIAKGLKPGARIRQGQVIGYVGSTGLATGPHLCFRFWKNGKQEDWLSEKIPPSEPISSANKLAFESTKIEYMERLALIRLPGEPEILLAETPKPLAPAKSE